MSVSQVSTSTTQTVSAAKNYDSVEIPFETAFANLKLIASLSIGQWTGTDPKDENKLVVWSYITTWLYNPDKNLVGLVHKCATTVLKVFDTDKENRLKIICEHESVAKGLQKAIKTFKPYPEIASGFEKTAALWNEKQPDKKSVSSANQQLILRTLRLTVKGTPLSDFSTNTLFEKQRKKNEKATLEGMGARQAESAMLPVLRDTFADAVAVRRGSSLLVGEAFQKALMNRRSKILGTTEKSM